MERLASRVANVLVQDILGYVYLPLFLFVLTDISQSF
jgi:hypothetical protein